MSTPIHLLVVEDSANDTELLLDNLIQAAFRPAWRRVETEHDYLAELANGADVIISDYSLPQFDGLHALRLLQESGLDIPFIVVTGSIGEERAIECMKQGATDYLLKDRLARLGDAVRHVLEV